MGVGETFFRYFTVIYCLGVITVLDMLLIESKYKKKTYMLATVVCGALCVGAVVILKLVGGMELAQKWTPIVTILPSAIFFFIMAKHRDGRVFFAFCTADMFGMAFAMLGTVVGMGFKNNIITVSVSRIIMITLLLVVVLKYLQKPYLHIMDISKKGWGAASVVAILFYALLYAYFIYPTPMETRPEDVVVGVLIIVLLFAVYAFIFDTIFRLKRVHSAEKTEQGLRLQIAMQRKLLKNMAFTEKSTIYCENIAVNRLLCAQLAEARRRGIAVKCQAEVQKNIACDDMELCVMLSNLLENATEAAGACVDGEKWMSLSIVKNKKQLCIKLENAHSGVVECGENAEYITTKTTGGIGLKCVNTVVEKYKGIIDISHTNNVFTVFVALKV